MPSTSAVEPSARRSRVTSRTPAGPADAAPAAARATSARSSGCTKSPSARPATAVAGGNPSSRRSDGFASTTRPAASITIASAAEAASRS